jgi:trigger factor
VLERKRHEHVDMIPIDQNPEAGGRDRAAETDTLVIALTGDVGQNKFEGEELQIELGSARPGPIPGLQKALLGVPLNAVDHEVTFSLPTEGIRPELAGQELHLKITVKQAYEKKVPALDDDFAKDTGEAETMEELRQKVRDQILKDDGEEAKDEARMAVLDEVVRRNPVPLPPSLIKRLSEQIFDMQRQRALIAALQEGKDVRQEGVLDEAKLREEAHGEAVRNLSKEFILMTVAEKESVEVTQADVEKRLAELARQSDKSVGRVRAEMQKDDPQLEGLRSSLRLEKALDLLESRAKIVEAGS